MAILLLVVGLVLFIGLVVVHEFGHFIVARRNGVDVEEFAIFFGPAVYQRKTKAGWLFSFRTIPLGGYVKLKGEHDSDKGKGAFGAASVWVKSKIMAAGVVMNLLTAFVLFTILAFTGIPKLIPNQYTVRKDTKLASQQVLIGDVEPGSPAAKAGLKPEDTITDISLPGYSPVAVNDYSKLPDVTKHFAGQTVTIFYLRAGQHRETTAKLLAQQAVAASQKTDNPKGYLGIVPTQFTIQRSTWSAPIVAIGLTGQVTALTYQGLAHAIGGLGSVIAGAVTGNNTARQHGQTSASSQVGGPVSIFFILKDGSLLGWQFMLFIIAIISLTLAIMNILPIPGLDGGRLWLTLFTRGIKRPLSAKTEEAIIAAGYLVIISLIILVTIVDVHRWG
ncbi:MAG TPA: M50 family metallopeptidase [Candidatus Saccharimonadia bacterium]|nr:M50 family metallopeptidase [Candidatus Saccharimonadia bacterium]